jgi:hypothetical protein
MTITFNSGNDGNRSGRNCYRIVCSVNTETEAGHRIKRGGMGRIDGKSD